MDYRLANREGQTGKNPEPALAVPRGWTIGRILEGSAKIANRKAPPSGTFASINSVGCMVLQVPWEQRRLRLCRRRRNARLHVVSIDHGLGDIGSGLA